MSEWGTKCGLIYSRVATYLPIHQRRSKHRNAKRTKARRRGKNKVTTGAKAPPDNAPQWLRYEHENHTA